MSKSLVIELVTIIAIVVVSFGYGLWLGMVPLQANIKPEVQIIERIVEKPIEVRVVVEVEKLVEKIIEVKVPVIQELEFREFNDEQELEDWLRRYYKTHILLVSNQVRSVCYISAKTMAEAALKNGYFMWVEIIDRYTKTPNGVVINENGKVHAVCGLVIGDTYYFIEPQLKEYWSMYKVE